MRWASSPNRPNRSATWPAESERSFPSWSIPKSSRASTSSRAGVSGSPGPIVSVEMGRFHKNPRSACSVTMRSPRVPSSRECSRAITAAMNEAKRAGAMALRAFKGIARIAVLSTSAKSPLYILRKLPAKKNASPGLPDSTFAPIPSRQANSCSQSSISPAGSSGGKKSSGQAAFACAQAIPRQTPCFSAVRESSRMTVPVPVLVVRATGASSSLRRPLQATTRGKRGTAMQAISLRTDVRY